MFALFPAMNRWAIVHRTPLGWSSTETRPCNCSRNSSRVNVTMFSFAGSLSLTALFRRQDFRSASTLKE